MKNQTSKLPKEKVLRHQISFEHDLFKLSVATFKRNVSYKYLQPEIIEAEHVHFFHSKNSKGAPQKYCHAVGGHFHEVTVDWDTGKATCGPALTRRTIKIPNTSRSITRIGTVKWDAINMDTGDQSEIVDDHTHEVEYIRTEVISEQTVRDIHEKDRAQVGPLVNSERLATQGAALQKLKQGELSNSKASE